MCDESRRMVDVAIPRQEACQWLLAPCISSWEGSSAIFKVRRVTRPAQWLGRPTCSCSSTSSTLNPSAVMCCATLDPQDPPPATTASYNSRNLTAQSLGPFVLPAPTVRACVGTLRVLCDNQTCICISYRIFGRATSLDGRKRGVSLPGGAAAGSAPRDRRRLPRGKGGYSGGGMINSWPTSMRPGSLRP